MIKILQRTGIKLPANLHHITLLQAPYDMVWYGVDFAEEDRANYFYLSHNYAYAQYINLD